jgi:hypothetical protein
MDCDGDPLGTIECHFTQVTVSVFSAPEVEKARTEMKRQPFTAADRKTTRRDLCSLRKADIPEQPPQRAALTARALAMFAKACACQDDQCFDREMIESLAAQEGKCRVWTHTFEARLNRVHGQQKWVGMSEPQGLCRALNATVVESDEKGLFWKFTQTRLTTDDSTELCKGLTVNVPAIYSSAVSGAALLNCEVVEFGH